MLPGKHRIRYQAYSVDSKAMDDTAPILVNSKPNYEGLYEVMVKTGIRFDAGLNRSANVFVRMVGTHGLTKEIELAHPWRPLFQRGTSNIFHVATPTDIGDIRKLTIRHDGCGSWPKWFLGSVDVVNLNNVHTARHSHFAFGRWLALDVAGGKISRTERVTKVEPFRRAFMNRLTDAISDNHTVFSVFLAPPGDRFTRMQRTMTMMLFICGSLFANAFFFQGDGSRLNIVASITTGFISAAVVLLPTSLVVMLFKNTKAPASTLPVEIDLTKARDTILSFHDNSEQVTRTGQQKRRSSTGRRERRGTIQLRVPCPGAGARISAIASSANPSTKKKKSWRPHCKFEFPAWSAKFAWLLSIGLIVWFSYYCLLLSFDWGPRKSRAWLGAVFTSLFTSIVVRRQKNPARQARGRLSHQLATRAQHAAMPLPSRTLYLSFGCLCPFFWFGLGWFVSRGRKHAFFGASPAPRPLLFLL